MTTKRNERSYIWVSNLDYFLSIFQPNHNVQISISHIFIKTKVWLKSPSIQEMFKKNFTSI